MYSIQTSKSNLANTLLTSYARQVLSFRRHNYFGLLCKHCAEAPNELTSKISVLFAFRAGWQKRTDMLLAGRYQNRSTTVLYQAFSLDWLAADFYKVSWLATQNRFFNLKSYFFMFKIWNKIKTLWYLSIWRILRKSVIGCLCYLCSYEVFIKDVLFSSAVNCCEI